MKINLTKKQFETLEEMMNLSIGFLTGVEEYKSDRRRYIALQESLENQISKEICLVCLNKLSDGLICSVCNELAVK